MHVSTRIQELITHARALTSDERLALRRELLRAAADLGIPVQTKAPSTPAARGRWPRIGGVDLVVAPDLTVETDEYQRRWQPSDVVVWIYVLGCPGLQELGRLLGLPLFKPGTTTGGIQDRLRELGRDGYGAAWRSGDRIITDAGFGAGLWVAEQLPVTLDLSPLSPVHPSVRGIGVRLPVGLTYPTFERRLAAEVTKASLGQIIGSAAGRALCADRGVDPARCRRITRYVFGADVRPSSEEEFTVFRPRSESDRLVAIAERIVVRHVMGLDR